MLRVFLVCRIRGSRKYAGYKSGQNALLRIRTEEQNDLRTVGQKGLYNSYQVMKYEAKMPKKIILVRLHFKQKVLRKK